MQTHNIVRKTKNKKAITVGRGGKRGKTSGRGTKGQKARAGRKIRPEMRDTIKKIPKLRGRGISSFKSYAIKPSVLNLKTLEKEFSAGDVVSPKTLLEKKVLSTRNGKNPKVKILSDGEISKKLTIEGCEISAKAQEKIVAAGGEVK